MEDKSPKYPLILIAAAPNFSQVLYVSENGKLCLVQDNYTTHNNGWLPDRLRYLS